MSTSIRNRLPGTIEKIVSDKVVSEIVGRFVFHCHVVKHEDKGIMMTVEVVR